MLRGGCEGGKRENRLSEAKSILLIFRARAGSKQCISFFFILIGFKEFR
jgi:hypothetical protein